MTLDNVRELLEKYYEGQTNIEEERALKQYFSNQERADFGDQEFFKAILEFKSSVPESPCLTKAKIRKTQFIHILHKVAAVLIIGLLLAVFGVHFHDMQQKKTTAKLNRKLESDLLSVSRILNENSESVINSIEPIVEIKTKKTISR